MSFERLRNVGRRKFLKGGLAAGLTLVAAETVGKEVMKEIADLKPGEYTWHPDRQPTGPVAIVVSLPEQLVHVYRNGIRVAVSTCSSGRAGYDTPTGVFVILQKAKVHHSSTYNEASMPNTERLTWSGVALHAGGLPGYPSSHGCVHLPLDFSAKLFEITHLGTPVIISGSHTDPWQLIHPGLVLSGYADTEFNQVEAGLSGKTAPSDWTEAEVHPVISVIASSSDRRIEMVQDSDIVATGNLSIKGSGSLGSHVFVLQGADDGVQGMRWSAITYSAATGAQADANAMQRLTADTAFIDKMKEKMHPGMIMILTDAPLSPDMRSGKDFVILSQQG